MAKVVAEIGCNHKGSLEIALEMVKVAAMTGCDIVKFQKRSPSECLRPEIYNSPHPNPQNAYGETYGEHRNALELDLESHQLLKTQCEKYGVEYSCTPFDLTSAKEILALSPNHVKISSFHNNNHELIDYILENHSGTFHISLGMTTKSEYEELKRLIREKNKMSSTVFYWCTSAYPCLPKNLYLNEIPNLIKDIGDEALAIGFSGHHDGIAMDLIARTYGATYFERHFTLDHNWKGTDHKASLIKDGLTRLVRDLRSADQALREKPSDITEEELHNRSFHKHVVK